MEAVPRSLTAGLGVAMAALSLAPLSAAAADPPLVVEAATAGCPGSPGPAPAPLPFPATGWSSPARPRRRR